MIIAAIRPFLKLLARYEMTWPFAIFWPFQCWRNYFIFKLDLTQYEQNLWNFKSIKFFLLRMIWSFLKQLMAKFGLLAFWPGIPANALRAIFLLNVALCRLEFETPRLEWLSEEISIKKFGSKKTSLGPHHTRHFRTWLGTAGLKVKTPYSILKDG